MKKIDAVVEQVKHIYHTTTAGFSWHSAMKESVSDVGCAHTPGLDGIAVSSTSEQFLWIKSVGRNVVGVFEIIGKC